MLYLERPCAVDESDRKLFRQATLPGHSLHHLLPPKTSTYRPYQLRKRQPSHCWCWCEPVRSITWDDISTGTQQTPSAAVKRPCVTNKNRLVFLLFPRKRRQKINRILMIERLMLQMIIVTTVQVNVPTADQHRKTMTLKRAVILKRL